MKIIETVQIGQHDNGTYSVWSKSHDEVVDCSSYAEALKVFQQFLGGIMDQYHDAIVDIQEARAGWYD